MNRELIANTYLCGHGIEIGALHNPLKVPKGARVKYVDRMHAAELREHYPELETLPLVPVDIIADGERLDPVQDGTQDFVIANHFLEHCQNPINAFINMLRVLRPGGILYIAVPDKRYTFDVHRPLTPLEHLIRDYEEGPEWSKPGHFSEWAQFVNGVNEEEALKAEAERLMAIDYSIHFHVWTQTQFMELLLMLKQRFSLPFEVELFFQNGQHEVIAIIRKDGTARLPAELGMANLSRRLDARRQELEAEQQARQRELEEKATALNVVSAEMVAKATQLNNILNSRAWRWVCRYGRVKEHYLQPVYRFIRPLSRAKRRRLTLTGQYERWVKEHDALADADRKAIRARIEALRYRPLISVVMPTYDVDERYLRAAIESVRRQLYSRWELCIADDCSSKPHVREVLQEYAEKDRRIKIVFRPQNGHIAAASNSALELASGEFVAFLDHDDELSEHALYMVAEELNAYGEADLIYSDEDKIDEQGERSGPHFKPDWSPDLFYSYNLITHLSVYRTSVVKGVGGFRAGYDGSQDYDLALRVVEQVPEDHIRHIPHILYHWRTIPGSIALDSKEKEYAHEAARDSIRAHLKRKGLSAIVTPTALNCHRVTYQIPEPSPLVSIIIGTRDGADLLSQVVEDLFERTVYQPIEIVIVNNQSTDPHTLSFLAGIQSDSRVKVVEYDAPFNYSAINNLGVRQSSGKVVCLLNNDIKVISSDWLREMVSHALRPEIGAVGAKLYYPNDTIQHAGVVLGLGGVAGHSHKHFPQSSPGHAGRLLVIQNYSAVTGACMALRREVFDEAGGLDEVNLPIAYNDIDLCLRIRERGYRILWTPYAELYHVESATRGPDDVQKHLARFRQEQNYMKLRWPALIRSDPYYNPNLTLDAEDLSIARVPRAAKPWKEKEPLCGSGA